MPNPSPLVSNPHALPSVGEARAGGHEPRGDGGHEDEETGEAENGVDVREDEDLRCSHREDESADHCTENAQELLLTRRANRRQCGEGTGDDRRGDAGPWSP